MDTKLDQVVVATDDLVAMMEYAGEKGVKFYVVGEGGMITRHHIVNGIDYMPLYMFPRKVPEEGLEIVEGLKKRVSLRGVIIGDVIEAKPKTKMPTIAVPSDFDWDTALTVLAAIGTVILIILAVATVLPILVVVGGLAMMTCGGGDPVIICVLNDGTYVQVFAWVE